MVGWEISRSSQRRRNKKKASIAAGRNDLKRGETPPEPFQEEHVSVNRFNSHEVRDELKKGPGVVSTMYEPFVEAAPGPSDSPGEPKRKHSGVFD